VVRFNAEGPAGLLDHKAPGKTSILNAGHRAALARAVEAGPKPYLDGVVRWRLIDLVQWLWDTFGIYDQDPAAGEAFKKTSPPAWRRSGGARPTASA
jgi:hypothetical protein